MIYNVYIACFPITIIDLVDGFIDKNIVQNLEYSAFILKHWEMFLSFFLFLFFFFLFLFFFFSDVKYRIYLFIWKNLNIYSVKQRNIVCFRCLTKIYHCERFNFFKLKQKLQNLKFLQYYWCCCASCWWFILDLSDGIFKVKII